MLAVLTIVLFVVGTFNSAVALVGCPVAALNTSRQHLGAYDLMPATRKQMNILTQNQLLPVSQIIWTPVGYESMTFASTLEGYQYFVLRSGRIYQIADPRCDSQTLGRAYFLSRKPKTHYAESGKELGSPVLLDGQIYYPLKIKPEMIYWKELLVQFGILKVSKGESYLAHPDVANQTMRERGVNSQFQFVAHHQGSISQETYLRFLAKGLVPIGLGGLMIHDFTEHGPGYILWGQTKLYSLLQDKIRRALAATQNARFVKQGVKAVGTINGILEAGTVGLVETYISGNSNEFQEFIETQVRLINSIDLPSECELATEM